MKKLNLKILLYIFVLIIINGCNNKELKNKDIDYLKYNFKHIDANYKIDIDSLSFDEGISRYGFYRDKIIDYRDSLFVVMMIELRDWDKARVAVFHIGYTWLRLGYHTWQSPDEARNFAEQFGISHPWRMKEFLIDEKNTHLDIINFFNDLKTKISKRNSSISFKDLRRSEILLVGLQTNPRRIEDYQKIKYMNRHGDIDTSSIGKDCGKEDCCQK